MQLHELFLRRSQPAKRKRTIIITAPFQFNSMLKMPLKFFKQKFPRVDPFWRLFSICYNQRLWIKVISIVGSWSWHSNVVNCGRIKGRNKPTFREFNDLIKVIYRVINYKVEYWSIDLMFYNLINLPFSRKNNLME